MTEVTANNTVRRKSGFKKFMIISLLLIIVGLVAFYFIAGLSYSEGTRSGILTKVSKRGYVFKTYEGEILIGGINEGEGTIINTTTFKFSVPEKSVYDKLEALQGHKVVVRYKQVLKPFFWQGDTDYFVVEAGLAK
jgi:hypothetical protein